MQKYVIEKRNTDGTLDFSDPQPAEVFGMEAITGISEDRIAKIVWVHVPEAVLEGREFYQWASMIDEGFSTRLKYW